jgi:hypothetical protein
LACADTIATSASCTVFTTVTDPMACSLTQSINAWSETAEASIALADYGSTPGYEQYNLASGAGPYGNSTAQGTATIELTFGGSYEIEVGGSAMGGSDGLSNVTVSVGGQSWAIGDYQDIDFTILTTPGEGLSGVVTTEGVGYASLQITEEGDPAPVPEPATLWLMGAGLALIMRHETSRAVRLFACAGLRQQSQNRLLCRVLRSH